MPVTIVRVPSSIATTKPCWTTKTIANCRRAIEPPPRVKCVVAIVRWASTVTTVT